MNEKKQKNFVNVRVLTGLALLFALAIVLMVIEGMIPSIPMLPPGIKLGLSNIVVMYCLFYLGKRSAFIILFLKAFFVFLTRGIMAFFMSLCGGFLSILVMIFLLLLKKRNISYIIISICAAVAHNIAQLIVSSIYLQSTAVFFYLPVLIISGVLMGSVTGVLLKVMMPVMGRLFFKSTAQIFNKTGGHNVDCKKQKIFTWCKSRSLQKNKRK